MFSFSSAMMNNLRARCIFQNYVSFGPFEIIHFELIKRSIGVNEDRS